VSSALEFAERFQQEHPGPTCRVQHVKGTPPRGGQAKAMEGLLNQGASERRRREPGVMHKFPAPLIAAVAREGRLSGSFEEDVGLLVKLAGGVPKEQVRFEDKIVPGGWAEEPIKEHAHLGIAHLLRNVLPLP
jgi:hypothetical protein